MARGAMPEQLTKLLRRYMRWDKFLMALEILQRDRWRRKARRKRERLRSVGLTTRRTEPKRKWSGRTYPQMSRARERAGMTALKLEPEATMDERMAA